MPSFTYKVKYVIIKEAGLKYFSMTFSFKTKYIKKCREFCIEGQACNFLSFFNSMKNLSDARIVKESDAKFQTQSQESNYKRGRHAIFLNCIFL